MGLDLINRWYSLFSGEISLGKTFFSLFISAPIMCNDPLNLNDIFQPVLPNNFGSNSIRKSIHFEMIPLNDLF